MKDFMKKGFADPNAIITGAGYAGGIMSAAVDGIKITEKIGEEEI